MRIVCKILLVLAILATTYNRAFCQEDNQNAWLDSLAQTIASMPDDSLKVRRLDSVALFHSNVDTILKYSEWELRLSQKLVLPRYVIEAYGNLGFAYYNICDYHRACDCYLEAVRLSDSLQFKRAMAMSRHALANTYAMLNDYINSNRLDCEALDIFREINDTSMMCDTYRTLAHTYIDYQLGNSAAEYIYAALTLDSATNNKHGISMDFYYLGLVERMRYDYINDLRCLRRSIDYMKTALNVYQDEYDQFMIYSKLMFSYIKMARENDSCRAEFLDSSGYYHYKASIVADMLGIKKERQELKLWEAVSLTEEGDYNAAYQIFKTIEANYVADSSAAYLDHYVDLYYQFAQFYAQTGNYKSALEYYQKSDNLRNRVYNNDFVAETAKYREKVKHQKEQAANVKAKEESESKMRYAFIALASVIVLLTFVANSYFKNKRINKILLDSNAEIELQRDQLKHINDEITSSIRYAQKIQEALLPQSEALNTIFNGCLLYWKPLEIVSGDFYWVQQTARYKFLAVGDCTGHGVPGAFLSMLGISSLTDIVMSLDFEKWQPSAGEILNILRTKMISSLRQSIENEDDTKDGIDLAFCILDTQNYELHFAGAMRPLLIYRDYECIQQSGDRIPVGVSFKQNIPFTNHIIKVYEDDTVYLFTDGVVDQFGFVNGVETKFNRKRLCAMLSQIYSLPFDEQERRIEAAFDEWASSGHGIRRCPQVDDQLLIGIRL